MDLAYLALIAAKTPFSSIAMTRRAEAVSGWSSFTFAPPKRVLSLKCSASNKPRLNAMLCMDKLMRRVGRRW